MPKDEFAPNALTLLGAAVVLVPPPKADVAPKAGAVLPNALVWAILPKADVDPKEGRPGVVEEPNAGEVPE